jgi:hypothetical protein
MGSLVAGRGKRNKGLNPFIQTPNMDSLASTNGNTLNVSL